MRPDIDYSSREAAHHAFTVMTFMAVNTKSTLFPNGFSQHRSGILAGPGTQDEFLQRIEELQRGIQEIIDGKLRPRMQLLRDLSLFKVVHFFRVGSELALSLPEVRILRLKNRNRSLTACLVTLILILTKPYKLSFYHRSSLVLDWEIQSS